MSLFHPLRLKYITREGSYVDGRWTETESDPVDFKASLQPVTANEMQTLPEGRRDRTTYKAYTKTDLKTVSIGEQISDIVLDGSERYEVVAAMRWRNGLINHTKLLLQKEVVSPTV